ncbi:MAG: hypothetical protein RR539_03025 [Clostridium sp.]|uniref:hypothetical protein n=1 Tax=Clostridium sp. TaxID=1506 RepID=UPI002FCA4F35
MDILVGIILVSVVVIGIYVGVKNHRNEPKNKPNEWISNIEDVTYIAGLSDITSGSKCRVEVLTDKLLFEYDGIRHLVKLHEIPSYKIVSSSYILEKVNVGKLKIKGDLVSLSNNKKLKFNNFIEVSYKSSDVEYRVVLNMYNNEDLVRITNQIDRFLIK